jgi:hypothetical protein
MYYNRNRFSGQPKSTTTKVLLFAGYKSNTLGYIFEHVNTLWITQLFWEKPWSN